MIFLAIFSGVLLALLSDPGVAYAQVNGLSDIVKSVVSRTPFTHTIPGLASMLCPGNYGDGACELAKLFVYAVERGRAVIGVIAFVIVVIAAFNLIVRQSEEAMTAARRTIVGVVIGLFLVFLSERMVDALYGGFTIDPGEVIRVSGNTEEGVRIMSEELLGILRWGETLVAITAIGLLVAQAAAVLASFGSEQTIQKAYRAVLSTVVGLLLIVFDRTIAAIFGFDQFVALPGAPKASIFVTEVFGIVRLLLGLVGVVAVGIILYAGFLMLLNFGNDELVTKSKTIIINAIIGLVLIAVSFSVVNWVILGIT